MSTTTTPAKEKEGLTLIDYVLAIILFIISWYSRSNQAHAPDYVVWDEVGVHIRADVA
jgi:dolichyl-phosphate-mannose--protein O-mannosyl transferase